MAGLLIFLPFQPALPTKEAVQPRLSEREAQPAPPEGICRQVLMWKYLARQPLLIHYATRSIAKAHGAVCSILLNLAGCHARSGPVAARGWPTSPARSIAPPTPDCRHNNEVGNIYRVKITRLCLFNHTQPRALSMTCKPGHRPEVLRIAIGIFYILTNLYVQQRRYVRTVRYA